MAKLTIKTFKEALVNSGGNQSVIAQKLGKDRSAVNHFLKKHPRMRALLEAEAERIIDVAENVIDADITKLKSVDSSKWKLLNSKRGKARGYGPKVEQELSGVVDNKIEVEIIRVDKKEDEDPIDDSI